MVECCFACERARVQPAVCPICIVLAPIQKGKDGEKRVKKLTSCTSLVTTKPHSQIISTIHCQSLKLNKSEYCTKYNTNWNIKGEKYKWDIPRVEPRTYHTQTVHVFCRLSYDIVFSRDLTIVNSVFKHIQAANIYTNL